ncbi:MAG: Asp-tRNA(Asn)/Glu-tRNA(Gln) amidotransferase GatCAB subunit A, partial [Chloroflexi bacterium]|nr:Asp-tRNA(Asn)/Glu-tRNA(Gln) amidotransferase GatCAB subunit A [Chloroflexota bacterium]
MSDTPLHYKTITELGQMIRSKEISPVEITRTLLARIGELDGTYMSYATLMSDHALASAQQAEDEIASGQYVGPLHGVPIAVKDLCFTDGVRTMGGSKVYI